MRWLSILTVALCGAGFALAKPGLPERTPELPFSKNFLKACGVPTDDRELAGLLLRISPKDRDFAALIEQLGDEKFARREEAVEALLALEDMSYPALRQAAKHPSAEVRRRAADCLERIEKKSRGYWFPTAVQYLAQRKPPGTLEALLAFLPFTCDPVAEEETYYTADEFMTSDKKAREILAAALTDPLAPRRAVAGCILALRGDQDLRAKARKLLDDPDPTVRLRTAQGFLAAADACGVPQLIDLLDTHSVPIAWQAEELLRWTAEETAPKLIVGAGTEKERAACKDAWRKWHAKHGKALDLAARMDRVGRPCLMMMVGRDAEGKKRLAWTCGWDGFPRFEMELPETGHDVQWIPEGGFAMGGPGWTIEERDISGKLVGRTESLRNIYSSFRRLGTGNFLALGMAQTLEYDPAGRVIHEKRIDASFQAHSLRPVITAAGRIYVPAPDEKNRWRMHEIHHATGKAINAVQDLPEAFGKAVNLTFCPLRNDGYVNQWWVTSPEYDYIYEERYQDGRLVKRSKPPRDRNFSTWSERLRSGNGIFVGGWSMDERTPSGDVVWELLYDYGRAPHWTNILPLVRFGFPAGKNVDTASNRAGMLASPDVKRRRYAAFRLSQLPFNEIVEKAAVNALSDSDDADYAPDCTVRHWAIMCLARPECKHHLPRLLDMLLEGKTYNGAMYSWFSKQAAEVAVGPLVEAYRDEQRRAHRQLVLTMLAWLYPGDKRVIPLARAALRDEQPSVREAAVAGTAWHKKEALIYLPELIRAINDRDTAIAVAAIRSCRILLYHHGPREEVTSALRAAMKRNDLREGARAALEGAAWDAEQKKKRSHEQTP